jgi:hypothetical protein
VKNSLGIALSGSCIAMLLCCMTARTAETTGPVAAAEAASSGSVMEIEWRDLLPETERAGASLAPPTAVHDYLLGESTPPPDQPMNFGINTGLADRIVRLPGFIVPLELDERGRVTELFLVPFFGACIHVPPPPPNQIVHVTMAAPLELGAMTAAYWITGRMSISTRKTRLGTSAYSMHEASSEEYDF